MVTLSSTCGQEEGEMEFRRLGIPVVPLGMRVIGRRDKPRVRFFGVVRGLFTLYGIFKELKPSLVQSWFYQSDILAGLMGKVLSIPVIWGIFLSNLQPKFYKKPTFTLIRLAGVVSRVLPARIISCSTNVTRAHRKIGYPEEKTLLIPPGTETEVFQFSKAIRHNMRRQNEVSDHEFLVGMVARDDPQKNFELLFEGVSCLLKHSVPAKLWLAGGYGIEESNPRFIALEKKYKLSGHVRYFGTIPKIEELYPALDCFVLTSFGEGLPMSLCEAMSAERACVASDVGDVKDLFGQSGGVALAEETAGCLANTLLELYNIGEAGRRRIGMDARAQIVTRFSDIAMTRSYEECYRSILD